MRKTTFDDRKSKTLYAVSGAAVSIESTKQSASISTSDSLKEIHAELIALLDELEEVSIEL
ncbi:MAG: hypothetical protein GJ680_01975 [Alteromonadaceae bacterium]|nr:hypothetical protein [Alteromonadaceae bacterium]